MQVLLPSLQTSREFQGSGLWGKKQLWVPELLPGVSFRWVMTFELYVEKTQIWMGPGGEHGLWSPLGDVGGSWPAKLVLQISRSVVQKCCQGALLEDLGITGAERDPSGFRCVALIIYLCFGSLLFILFWVAVKGGMRGIGCLSFRLFVVLARDCCKDHILLVFAGDCTLQLWCSCSSEPDIIALLKCWGTILLNCCDNTGCMWKTQEIKLLV